MKNDYQGEDDARTLARASEVMADPRRHKNAKGHLSKLHGDRTREAMHAKAAQGLRKAFPDEAAAGATASRDSYKAAAGKKPPARKKLGETPMGGPVSSGGTKTQKKNEAKGSPIDAPKK